MQRTIVSTLLVIALFHPTLPSLAQTPEDPLRTALAAHGNAVVVRAVSTIKLTGTSTTVGILDGPPGPQPVAITADLSGKLRVDYGRPVRRSLVYTPQGAAEIIGGRSARKSAHVGAFAELDLLSVFGMRQLADRGGNRTALASATLNGRAVSRVRASSNQKMTVYGREVKDDVDVSLDQATGLVAAVSRQQFADRRMDLSFILTTAFSDYRNVDGVLLPHRIDRYLDGVLREAIIIESIQLNPALSGNLFTR